MWGVLFRTQTGRFRLGAAPRAPLASGGRSDYSLGMRFSAPLAFILLSCEAARPGSRRGAPDDPADGGAAPETEAHSGGEGDSGGTESAPPDSGDSAGSGDTAGADKGETDLCGDPGVIPSFDAPSEPVLTPVDGDDDHGSDNIYAPDVVRVSDSLCLMYFGGQGGDGHDRIFLATSTDCHHWAPWPDREDPEAIIDNGSANHVNDPSVVVVDGTWYLYYTVAATGEDDRIHLATSTDGFTWSPQGLVLDVGESGSWDSWKVGRPAVIHRDGAFWLYYDGNDTTARHVGVATSTDGRSFTRHPANPLLLNVGAVDVERVGDTLVMLAESHVGTYAQTSADGLTWCDQGLIFGLTGADWDVYGQVTPFLFTRDGSSFDALFFGGASDACWCRNRVGQALPAGDARPADPDEGCGGCVEDSDCTQACRDGGYGVDGVCAAPGSTDPGACCACVSG